MSILQEKEIKEDGFGIYVHVPFCASTCDFCSFYQEKPKKNSIQDYLKGIQEEIELIPPPKHIDTLFWGGGTPGLLHAKDLQTLASHILNSLESLPSEWTVEMAPSTIKPDKLLAIKEFGVNRISMGAQSFNPRTLDALGRQHSQKQILQGYQRIQEAAFDNINIDLIFAYPGQSIQDWENDLDQAIALNPDHISTYCLIFEEDAALYAKPADGKWKIDPEQEAQFFELTWKKLAEAGYEQYEIANYAKPGKACQHNINTWKMKEWWGYGPSAASQYNSKRLANIPNLEQWLEGIRNKNPVYQTNETLSPETLAEDHIIFGLRMNQGINLKQIQHNFPQLNFTLLQAKIDSLVEEKHIDSQNGFYRLTSKGRLLADQVAINLMDALS